MRKAHLTGVGTRTIQYDAERHLVSVNNNGSAVSFTYNASGLRVQSTWPSNPASFLYDPNGTWVGNNASGAWSSSAVYLGLRPLAFDGGGAAQFLHVNALASTTMETSYNGGLSSDVLFYPWGEMWKNPVQTDYQFAGTIWMDGTSSSDFATYRLYRYDQGRWLTPDPAGLGAVDPSNPQSWNGYAYVMNNPLALVDPLGLDYCMADAALGDGAYADWGCMSDDDFAQWSKVEGFDPSQFNYNDSTQSFTYTYSTDGSVVDSSSLESSGGGGGSTPLAPNQQPANNVPNPRLLNIAQQIQGCPAFSNVGNQIAQRVNSGRISVGNVASNGVAQTNGWFNATSVIAPGALDDPSTVIHEWIHQTQAAGNPLFIFLKGANQIQSLFTSDNQGFLDNSAQAVANKIVSVCGVK